MISQKSVDRLVLGLPMADPEEAGFSSDRLARIRPAMKKYIDCGMIPGSLTLAARHGRIVHFDMQGLMDVEANKPMQEDAIFRLASMTKPIACVALLMLYEEGHFLLDQPISRYLPAFKNMAVKTQRDLTEPANREINFRDCLTHTAGFSSKAHGEIRTRINAPSLGAASPVAANPVAIGDAGKLPRVGASGSGPTVAQVVDELAKLPLNNHPGIYWEYNPGHDVVGVLVETISGQTLDGFLKERIFDPLNMVDTHFYLPEEKLPRFAAGYAVDVNNGGRFGLVDRPESSEKVLGPKTYFSGAGGLISTPGDYARFAQMLLNGGILDGARILGRKTIELMTTNHTGDLDVYVRGPGYGFGLGVFVRTSLSANPLVGSLGAYGWGGAFCTSYFADPREDLFGLQFTQVRDYGQNRELVIRQDFERMVYQALVGD